jgi:hypothetical protein
MSTFIHGIATVQFIDSSGEVVDLKGHDISSLPDTGVFNWEHLKDQPAQLVGKILKAKKIYSASDCSDEHERMFWNRVKAPFVYVMGELLDDYCESAKACAGQLRYSADRPHQKGLLGFSVEGSSIPGTKEGVTIKRSIARKVSLTATPANKACVAEIMPAQDSQVKDDFASIFKSEQEAIDLFKSGEGVKIYEDFLSKKEDDLVKSPTLGDKPAKPAGAGTFGQRISNPGIVLGQTSNGHDVFSHAKVESYPHFNSQDHKEAAHLHAQAAEKATDGKVADMHLQKMKLHNQRSETLKRTRENRLSRGKADKVNAAINHAKNTIPLKASEHVCGKNLSKTLTAGNYDAAPSTLVNGAAYQKEHRIKESKWAKRSKEEYKNWAKREQFEQFMMKNSPKLTKGEIEAIGATIALKKALETEKALEKLIKPKK